MTVIDVLCLGGTTGQHDARSSADRDGGVHDARVRIGRQSSGSAGGSPEPLAARQHGRARFDAAVADRCRHMRAGAGRAQRLFGAAVAGAHDARRLRRRLRQRLHDARRQEAETGRVAEARDQRDAVVALPAPGGKSN